MLRTSQGPVSRASHNQAELQIHSQEIAGPFDLKATVKSGQTGMPEWLCEEETFTDILPTTNGSVVFDLRQTAGPLKPTLLLRIRAPRELGEKQIREARLRIIRSLDLERDLSDFYRSFSDEAIAEAFQRFPGLRLMRGWDPFESLISCMLTQWSSVRGWNTVARRLRRSFGPSVTFGDGSIFFGSPDAESIASAPMQELRRCGTGFRAKYLKEAAKMVANGLVDLKGVERLSYEEAKKLLMEVPGVGTKVADCVLLYGYRMLEAAPIDVWMHRVIQNLYLKGEGVGQKEAEEFMRKRFGSWAGYAQLYLYHYARMRRIQ